MTVQCWSAHPETDELCSIPAPHTEPHANDEQSLLWEDALNCYSGRKHTYLAYDGCPYETLECIVCQQPNPILTAGVDSSPSQS